jgi:hypothetical protein
MTTPERQQWLSSTWESREWRGMVGVGFWGKMMSQALTVSELLWRAAGAPALPSDERAGLCCLCGAESAGAPFARWVKDSFTNWDLLHSGTIACRACLFCAEEQSRLLQSLTGREKPQKMRTYSHFIVGGRWRALTKGEKPEMRRLLAQNPEVAVISVTGQKHLLFRARAGWWQFEETAQARSPAFAPPTGCQPTKPAAACRKPTPTPPPDSSRRKIFQEIYKFPETIWHILT